MTYFSYNTVDEIKHGAQIVHKSKWNNKKKILGEEIRDLDDENQHNTLEELFSFSCSSLLVSSYCLI